MSPEDDMLAQNDTRRFKPDAGTQRWQRMSGGISPQPQLCDVRHLEEVGSLRGWRTTDVA
jgi:hypothetical protein